jgi:hypothetical protein
MGRMEGAVEKQHRVQWIFTGVVVENCCLNTVQFFPWKKCPRAPINFNSISMKSVSSRKKSNI